MVADTAHGRRTIRRARGLAVCPTCTHDERALASLRRDGTMPAHHGIACAHCYRMLTMSLSETCSDCPQSALEARHPHTQRCTFLAPSRTHIPHGYDLVMHICKLQGKTTTIHTQPPGKPSGSGTPVATPRRRRWLLPIGMVVCSPLISSRAVRAQARACHL